MNKAIRFHIRGVCNKLNLITLGLNEEGLTPRLHPVQKLMEGS